MAQSKKIIPTKINTDLSANYFDEFTARFIKNLSSYVGATDAYEGIKEGQNVAVLKLLQSNELYFNLTLPEGECFPIGAKGFAQTNEIYVWVWNSLNNHFIYRINGSGRTAEIVKVDSCFNFQLNPKYFIHESGAWLEVEYLVDPLTGATVRRSLLFWTEGYENNPMGFLAVEDSIATNGFNENDFPYFKGDYDKCLLVRAGVPHYMDCFTIDEIKPTETDLQKNNKLLFQCLQVRIMYIDVWGRPSEHSIISDLYIPANNCLSASNSLARCLKLGFDAGNPSIDKIQVEYAWDNSQQWYLDTVISKYVGSNIGAWWTRPLNPNVTYDPTNNKIFYTFCADKEDSPIDQAETERTQNPLPRSTQNVFKLNEFLATANNRDGFKPIPQDVLEQIKFEVIPPPPPTSQENQLRTVVVLVSVYNYLINDKSGVYALTNTGGSLSDFVFGGYRSSDSVFIGSDVKVRYKQGFANTSQRGFIGTLGSSAVVSEQVYFNAGVIVKVTDDDYSHFDATKEYFQMFTFENVPPAVYLFRVCGQGSKVTDADFRNTSTYVKGLFSFSSNQLNPGVAINDETCELIVDVATANYSSVNDNKVLVIEDLTRPNQSRNDSCAIAGYVHETTVAGIPFIPVELLETTYSGSFSSLTGTRKTDHNGFYYFAFRGTAIADFNIFFNGYYKCSINLLARVTVRFLPLLIEANPILTNTSPVNGAVGFFADYFTIKCNRFLVEGFVKQCGTGVGVPNVGVVYGRGQYATTNAEGKFSIIAHDDATFSVSLLRTDSVYIYPSVCPFTGCDSLPLQPVPLLAYKCFVCSGQERVFTFNETLVLFVFKRGLLSGGRYGFGIAKNDWLRRHGFVNVRDEWYLDIPSVSETKTFTPSQIKLTIPPSATFSDEVEKLAIYITEEINNIDFIEWVADNVEFINNAGFVDLINPTQIKISYASLNEYNKQNNFNTTTGWQITPESATTPRISDTVEFLLNGDGTYFSKSIKSLIKYNSAGLYFTIDYTSDLKDLKPFALIRLCQPRTNTGKQLFYETCHTVNIKNNKAQENEIILNVFDTYYNYRQIPIPITTTAGDPPVTTTVNELRSFGFPFEHHSPSDFWGSHCKNIGRVNAKNPYEDEIIHLNQIMLSGGLSENGQLNYLNYFSDLSTKVHNPSVNNTGGVSGVVVDLGVVACITQFDYFLLGYNDNTGRVNADGTFQVPSLPDQFGKPQRKMGNTYGCQHIDKNSIRTRNGLTMFVDRSRAEAVQYNFSSVESLTVDKALIIDGVEKGKYDADFRAKIKSMQQDLTRYFTGGINPITNEYVLTDFSLSNRSYINTERQPKASANETITFDIGTRELKMFASFTGECYAFLDGDVLNNNLFTFKGALPYSFYNGNTNDSFNEFFGVQCEPVFTIINSSPPFKKKKFMVISNYCKQATFFSDQIITESGQLSYLFIDNFKQALYFTFAPFLRDVKTLTDTNLTATQNDNKLTEGNPLYGEWIQVRLVGNPATNNKYCEIFGVVIETNNYEKTG